MDFPRSAKRWAIPRQNGCFGGFFGEPPETPKKGVFGGVPPRGPAGGNFGIFRARGKFPRARPGGKKVRIFGPFFASHTIYIGVRDPPGKPPGNPGGPPGGKKVYIFVGI